MKLIVSTSFPKRLVALADQGKIVRSSYGTGENNHLEGLVPQIQGLVDEVGWKVGQLQSVIVDVGPGSFTGLRIGIATIRALTQALGISLVPVLGLEALARSCRGESLIVTLKGAQRDRVYAAVYRFEKDFEVMVEAQDLSLDELSVQEIFRHKNTEGKNPLFIGDAITLHRTALESLFAQVRARFVQMDHIPPEGFVAAGEGKKGVGYSDVVPVYLRKSEAERVKEKHG